MKKNDTDYLLTTLSKCIASCERSVSTCQAAKSSGSLLACMSIAKDCADICSITYRYISRDSRYSYELLEKCISICKDCENVCRKCDIDECQICAEICHECHKVCEEAMAIPA